MTGLNKLNLFSRHSELRIVGRMEATDSLYEVMTSIEESIALDELLKFTWLGENPVFCFLLDNVLAETF